ncbi:hypothetical protein EVJ58_g2560 [Rhodofomes roseus]|uniref:DUF7918 domain-containing protein n=1 Tax=Rhodofomes roseus TaxID=34475 RepID=A0A4Y9YTY2_9APHY|nr:hypothetical protein EVJ58_g2560 [Rhodofomes roseus]
MALNVYVDNYEFSKKPIMTPKELSRSITCQVGRNGIRPLMFSNISVTDDEDAAEEIPRVDDLGLIEIFVGRVKVLHEVPWSPPVGEPHNLGPVHESLKKGGMHCVSFGPTVANPYRRGRAVETDGIDTWSAPYIIFKFKYRPLATLQAGILQPIVVDPPRDDSPDKLPRSERPCKRPWLDGVSSTIIDLTDDTEDIKPSVPKDEDEDDDDMEDAAALEAQIQTLRQRLDRKRLRKARRGQSGAFKKEESPTQASRFNGEMIDLTEE